jgi:hypothetical protein
MPSGRTSMLAPQATDLLAIHPPYSEKLRSQPCRLPHERKLGDQTKDDADKEPREERSYGRSQTSLYNGIRTHRSFKDAPVSRLVQRAGVIRSRAILGGLHHHYGRVWGFQYTQPLMCSARNDVRGHIDLHKNDHRPSYRRYRAGRHVSKVPSCVDGSGLAP